MKLSPRDRFKAPRSFRSGRTSESAARRHLIRSAERDILVGKMPENSLKVNTICEGENVIVELVGQIDESASFPELKSEGLIKINLRGISRLNSVGTRAWCLWIQRFRAPAEIVLIECPVIMVKNFTLVKGFLNDRCRIYSFIVPYYSERTGERRDILLTWGKDFDSKGLLRLPEVTDKAGNPMEADVIPESYFAFISS